MKYSNHVKNAGEKCLKLLLQHLIFGHLMRENENSIHVKNNREKYSLIHFLKSLLQQLQYEYSHRAENHSRDLHRPESY